MRRRSFPRQHRSEWREADRAELPRFLEIVNEGIERCGDPDFHNPYEVDWDEKPREVLLAVPGRHYRAVLRRGVTPWIDPFKPIGADDVERFERRPT